MYSAAHGYLRPALRVEWARDVWPGTTGAAKQVAIDVLQSKDLVKLKHASGARCSMFFAEKRGGKLVPKSQPVSGYYDYYGRVSRGRRHSRRMPLSR